MAQHDDRIMGVAARHGLSPEAVQALAEAMERGRGGGAQWSHPELGGMGQWTRGGMLQIGDMFNSDLKARVARALDNLVSSEPAASEAHRPGTLSRAAMWWPAEFGQPASAGAQNAMRYATFPDHRRLVVERQGRMTVYDTGTRRLTGVSQAQGEGDRLTFSGPDGTVLLDDLTIVA